MKKAINQPLLWLMLQAALLCAVLRASGIHQVLLVEDSPSYLSYSVKQELISSSAPTSIRTFVYPLFLKVVHRISPTLWYLPHCQLAMHVVAVFLFYFGLRGLVTSDWLAMAVSSSLLYSNTILIDGAQMMTDAPALSLAILTIGMLLLVIRNHHNLIAWVGFTLSLFLTYETRPAYVFLIPLLPLLGVLLLGLVSSRSDWIRLRKRIGVGLVAASVLPFIMFCAIRWARVGHFGLVPLDGFALAGTACQLLTDDLVHELPEDMRPLAYVILKRKQGVPDRDQPEYHDYDYMRLRVGAPIWHVNGVLYELRGAIEKSDDEYYLYDTWEWNICSDGAKELSAFPVLCTSTVGFMGSPMGQGPFLAVSALRNVYRSPIEGHASDDLVTINRKLRTLSWEIIKARPLLYVRGVVKRVIIAMVLTLFNSYVFHVLLLLLLLSLIIWHAVYVIQRLRGGSSIVEVQPGPCRDYSLELNVMLLITISYTLSNVLLTASATPILRFTDAAGVFLPTVPVVALFVLWQRTRTLILAPSCTTKLEK